MSDIKTVLEKDPLDHETKIKTRNKYDIYVYQEMLGASWVEIVITREGSSFGVGNYQTGV